MAQTRDGSGQFFDINPVHGADLMPHVGLGSTRRKSLDLPFTGDQAFVIRSHYSPAANAAPGVRDVVERGGRRNDFMPRFGAVDVFHGPQAALIAAVDAAAFEIEG